MKAPVVIITFRLLYVYIYTTLLDRLSIAGNVRYRLSLFFSSTRTGNVQKEKCSNVVVTIARI